MLGCGARLLKLASKSGSNMLDASGYEAVNIDVSVLGQRRRRWTSTEAAMVQCLVFDF